MLTNATLIKAIESLSDWRKLGTYLNIPPHKLNTIADNNPGNVGRCKDSMLETWLLTNPSATWKDVMEAVWKLPDVIIAHTMKKVSPDQGMYQHHAYYGGCNAPLFFCRP